METIKFDFKSLDLYQKILDYIDWVYDVTEKFPKNEVFGLSSQWRRASTSLALNLSEGYGETYPLFTKYYKIFKGFLRESAVCSEISFRRKYIDSNDKQNSRSKLVEFSKMIVGLRKYLEKKDKGLI